MAEQVESEEALLAKVEVPRRPFVRTDPARDRVGAEEVKRAAAGDLDERVEALGGDADDEDTVDVFFLHARVTRLP